MSVILVIRINPASVKRCASITDIDDYELEMLKSLNRPNKTLVVNVGESDLGEGKADLNLVQNEETASAIDKIVQLLIKSVVLDAEYFI